ncbi:Conserved oligomeric Golgi complex subunit, partial [Cryomyces antarcticus]
MSELTGSLPAGGKREDYRAMVRSANTLLSLRQLFAANRPGEEGHGLDRINVIITLRSGLIEPMERTLLTRAQQIIREFSTSSLLASNVSQLSTYAQTEDTKSRATSALTTLYLLSPTKTNTTANFEPILLVSALQNYLQTALTSSLAALTRALATLPTLDRTLLEISARCQNIVALEALLESIKPPPHPLLTDTVVDVPTEPLRNFLQPLLTALDTSSLPSYFWR